MLPFIILTTATPAIITTNTMANPTDRAEVYLNESGKQMILSWCCLVAIGKRNKKKYSTSTKKYYKIPFHNTGTMDFRKRLG